MHSHLGSLLLVVLACLCAAACGTPPGAPLYPPAAKGSGAPEIVFGCNMGRSHCLQFFEVRRVAGGGRYRSDKGREPNRLADCAATR
jgi:hypothetical protein